ncbi:hypothetical protein [Nocardia suismassiliense]|uniref:hypothetical protein n=1 Tax=Nocardia suismassiliense TaxID=2077092 RepID=UPI00131F20C7|nr:hypothetical protein [Nocardia suismassiliense]
MGVPINEDKLFRIRCHKLGPPAGDGPNSDAALWIPVMHRSSATPIPSYAARACRAAQPKEYR